MQLSEEFAAIVKSQTASQLEEKVGKDKHSSDNEVSATEHRWNRLDRSHTYRNITIGEHAQVIMGNDPEVNAIENHDGRGANKGHVYTNITVRGHAQVIMGDRKADSQFHPVAIKADSEDEDFVHVELPTCTEDQRD